MGARIERGARARELSVSRTRTNRDGHRRAHGRHRPRAVDLAHAATGGRCVGARAERGRTARVYKRRQITPCSDSSHASRSELPAPWCGSGYGSPNGATDSETSPSTSDGASTNDRTPHASTTRTNKIKPRMRDMERKDN